MEAGTYGRRSPTVGEKLTTETKQAFKTTEFWVYIVLLLGLFIAGLVASSGDESSASAGDSFGADKVWLYATILTVGYLVSRGLAEAGSYEHDTEHHHIGGHGSDIGDRVRTAAQVIKDGPEAAQGSAGHPEAPTRTL
jgi:hypothetical protein